MQGFDIAGWSVMAAALCGAGYAIGAAILMGRFFKSAIPADSDGRAPSARA